MSEPTVRVANVVALVTLDRGLDLREIIRNVEGIEFNFEKFPGVIYRAEEPRASFLIFRTGKMICTGSKSEGDVYKAVERLVEAFKRGGITVGEPKVEINNMVALVDLKSEVNLEKAARLLENSIYEPDQFPGLIYRVHEPKASFLIFAAGKAICTGARERSDVFKAVEYAYKRLREVEALLK